MLISTVSTACDEAFVQVLCNVFLCHSGSIETSDEQIFISFIATFLSSLSELRLYLFFGLFGYCSFIMTAVRQFLFDFWNCCSFVMTAEREG